MHPTETQQEHHGNLVGTVQQPCGELTCTRKEPNMKLARPTQDHHKNPLCTLFGSSQELHMKMSGDVGSTQGASRWPRTQQPNGVQTSGNELATSVAAASGTPTLWMQQRAHTLVRPVEDTNTDATLPSQPDDCTLLPHAFLLMHVPVHPSPTHTHVAYHVFCTPTLTDPVATEHRMTCAMIVG